jgi:hypothetical protein
MGKKGHDLPKFLRQELVLNILENFSGDNGITTAEIYELLYHKCPGVNKRTLYRDLVELSERFPIYDETIDGKMKWFVENQSRLAIRSSLYREYIEKELFKFLKKEIEEELTPAI